MPTADATLQLATLFTADAGPINAAITSLRNLMSEYSSTVKAANNIIATSSKKTKKELNELQTTTNKLTSANKKAGASSDVLGTKLGKLTSVVKALKTAFKITAAYTFTYSVIGRITEAFSKGAQVIIDYDQAIHNLQAILGKVSKSELALLGETMQEIAKTTKFSTTEIGAGMQLLAQAGFSAVEAISAMQAVADLATGTLSSLETSSDLLTTTVRAFNLNASEASRVADVMANSINHSKLTIDKLRIAFNYVAASAAQMGISVEEAAATMQVLANNGQRASAIGTGFRQVLAKLIAPNRALREEFERHNVSLSEVNPSVVGYQTALTNLARVLVDNKTKTIDMGKAYDLFKLRGAQAAAVIIKSFASGDFQKALDNTYEVGTAAKMSAIQQEGLAVKFKNMADRAGLVARALGEAGLVGVFGGFVDIMKNLLSVMTTFIKSGLGSFILQAATLTIAVKGLGIALGFLLGLFNVASIEAFSTAMILLGLKVYEVVFAVNSLSAAMVALRGTMATSLRSVNFWITALIILGIGLYKLFTMHQKAAEAARENATAHRQMVSDLENTSSVLERNKDNYTATIATLRRFSKEHKETADAVAKFAGVQDIASLSVEQFKTAAESVKLSEFKKQISSLADVFGEINKSAFWNIVRNITLPHILQDEGFDKKIIAETASGVNDIANAIAEMGFSTQKTQKELEIYIDNLVKEKKLHEDIADRIKTKSIKAYNELLQSQKRMKEFFESITSEGTVAYESFYNKLSLLEQARRGDVFSKLEQEAVEYERHAQKIGHTAEQQFAVKAALRAKGLANFTEKEMREISIARKIASEKKQLEIDILEAKKEQYIKSLRMDESSIENQISFVKRRFKFRIAVIKDQLKAESGLTIEERNRLNNLLFTLEKQRSDEIKKLEAEQILTRQQINKLIGESDDEIALKKIEKEKALLKEQIDIEESRLSLNATINGIDIEQSKKSESEKQSARLNLQKDFFIKSIAMSNKYLPEIKKTLGEESDAYKSMQEQKLSYEQGLAKINIKISKNKYKNETAMVEKSLMDAQNLHDKKIILLETERAKGVDVAKEIAQEELNFANEILRIRKEADKSSTDQTQKAVESRKQAIIKAENDIEIAKNKIISQETKDIYDEYNKQITDTKIFYAAKIRIVKETDRATKEFRAVTAQKIKELREKELADLLAIQKKMLEASENGGINLNAEAAKKQIAELTREILRLRTLISGTNTVPNTFFEQIKSGAKDAATEISSQIKDTGQIAKTVMVESFNGISDALTDALTSAKTFRDAFKGVALSVLKDLTNMIIKQQIFNLLVGGYTGATSGPGSVLGGMFGGIKSFFTGPAAHTGGVIGATPLPVKTIAMPPMQIQKYHSGMPDEYAAILKKGEGVFTKEQMAAMGPSGQNVNVEVNITNKSGQAVSGRATDTKYDGSKYVIGVVLDALNKNRGGFRTQLKTSLGNT